MKRPKSINGMGYVYLKTHPNAKGLHKIGFTRRPAAREEQLGGEDCVVVARVMSLNPEKLEKDLHRKFDSCRVPQSEWFNLNAVELDEICEALEQEHEKALAYVVVPSIQVLKPQPQRNLAAEHMATKAKNRRERERRENVPVMDNREYRAANAVPVMDSRAQTWDSRWSKVQDEIDKLKKDKS